MATLLPNGRQVFLGLDGKPLAGGLVFFYVPNTTVFRDTFQDPGASQKNTNPVTLDAAGTATIFGVGVYRQVLKAADGTVIWDRTTADTSAAFASWGGTAAGSANHIALTVLNFTSADGQAVDFIAGFTNTGPVDVALNKAPAIPTVKDSVSGPVALAGGEIVAGNVYRVTYNATAGLFHLSYLFDRAYVDGQTSGALGAAKAYAAAQAAAAQSAAISTAEAYAAQQAAAAQAAAAADATAKANAAQSAAAADASAKANAAQSAAQSYAQTAANNAQAAAQGYAQTAANNAQNAAYGAATSYAANADATVAANANSYAASQASSALSQANGYTNAVAANTTADAHAYADNSSNNAYNSACAFAQGAANGAQAGAINAAEASAFQNYVAQLRLSGYYSATGSGRQSGSVMIDYGGGQNVYKYIQIAIGNRWITIVDA